MCTVLLPPGVNPIAVNKYIDIKILKTLCYITCSSVRAHIYEIFLNIITSFILDFSQRAITNPNPCTKILGSTSHSHNPLHSTSAPLSNYLLEICCKKSPDMWKCIICGFSYERVLRLWMEHLAENNFFFIFRTSLVAPLRAAVTACRPNDW